MTEEDDSHWDNSKERRAGHRARAPELLKAAEISFSSNNAGAHLIVAFVGLDGNGHRIDFYPGTGLWIPQGGRRGRGIFKLIRYVIHRRKPPCPEPESIETQMRNAESILVENGPTTPSGPSTSQ
jgi:hypothetical protein